MNSQWTWRNSYRKYAHWWNLLIFKSNDFLRTEIFQIKVKVNLPKRLGIFVTPYDKSKLSFVLILRFSILFIIIVNLLIKKQITKWCPHFTSFHSTIKIVFKIMSVTITRIKHAITIVKSTINSRDMHVVTTELNCCHLSPFQGKW